MNFLRRLTLGAWVVLAATACQPEQQGGSDRPPSGDPSDGPDVVAVTSVSLSETTVTVEVGSSVVLTASLFPPNSGDVAVTWKSEDVSIATVQGGKVTGVSPGATRVTATAGGKSAVCKVNVTEKYYHVESVEIEPDEVTVMEGDGFTLEARVLPENANNPSIRWEQEEYDTILLEAEGFTATVTALKPGRVTVKAIAEDGEVEGMCTITVERRPVPVESISIDPQSLDITEEDSALLTATVLPENADDKTITWKVEDPSVALISPDGFSATLTAISGGRTVVTATSADGSVSATCTVNVQALARDADFTQKVFYCYPGAQFTPEAVYTDGREAIPEGWQVIEGEFLTVSETGLVTVTGYSLSPGRISAMVGEGSISATIWSALSVSVDGSEVPDPADVPRINLSLDGKTTATVEIKYMSALSVYEALPVDIIPESEDVGVASVSANGSTATIKAEGSGEVKVTMDIGPATVTVPVFVTGRIDSDDTITYPEDNYGTL